MARTLAGEKEYRESNRVTRLLTGEGETRLGGGWWWWWVGKGSKQQNEEANGRPVTKRGMKGSRMLEAKHAIGRIGCWQANIQWSGDADGRQANNGSERQDAAIMGWRGPHFSHAPFLNLLAW